MQLELHPDAQAEIVEAVVWYEQRAIGLGDDLLVELEAAFRTILGGPEVWPSWPGSSATRPIRRYLLARFRLYAVAYQHFGDRVVVLAIVHLKRKPFYWLDRVTTK